MTGRSLLCLTVLAACGGGSSDPDAAPCLCDAPVFDAVPDPDVDPLAPDAEPPDGPRPVDLFNHFTLDVTTGNPTQGIDFDIAVHAYSSGDNSTTLDYDGSLQISASCGALTGDTSGPITDGLATLTVQTVGFGDDCVITVTDETYPSMTADTMVDIVPQGASADTRDIVINEVNWFGNSGSFLDEWIELRNTTDSAINMSAWVIENGSTVNLALPLGTSIAPGGYLVIGRMQGPDTDGNRTSLTGVTPVLVAAVDLVNGGEQLTLRDIDGDLVDQTPAAPWPAGDNTLDRTMERRDNFPGAYTDGSQAAAWYTFNPFGGSDTTNADSSDQGTPGAANSEPPAVIYTTSFEAAQPTWGEPVASGAYDIGNTPPTDTAARTGTQIATTVAATNPTTNSLTTSFGGRLLTTTDCIALPEGGLAPVFSTVFGTAGTANATNVVRGRLLIQWYTDAACTTAHATPANTGTSVIFPQGSYAAVTLNVTPPDGTATHVKLLIDAHDDASGEIDAWALDDVTIRQ